MKLQKVFPRKYAKTDQILKSDENSYSWNKMNEKISQSEKNITFLFHKIM